MSETESDARTKSETPTMKKQIGQHVKPGLKHIAVKALELWCLAGGFVLTWIVLLGADAIPGLNEFALIPVIGVLALSLVIGAFWAIWWVALISIIDEGGQDLADLIVGMIVIFGTAGVLILVTVVNNAQ